MVQTTIHQRFTGSVSNDRSIKIFYENIRHDFDII